MNNLRGKTILVADAAPKSRDALADEFRRAGCEVFSTSGGIEAYEIARDNSVHAVIASDQLSSGDPAQLLADIRRLYHDIPLILFGGATPNISQGDALNLGYAAYFRQAFPAMAIAESISRSLEFVKERKKKRVERVGVAGVAKFTFGQPAVSVTAPILNLSKGGMFLSLEKDFPPQQAMVVFQISFNQDEFESVIDGVAVVRWVRESPSRGMIPGVGLEFSVLAPESEAALKAYLIRTCKSPTPMVG